MHRVIRESASQREATTLGLCDVPAVKLQTALRQTSACILPVCATFKLLRPWNPPVARDTPPEGAVKAPSSAKLCPAVSLSEVMVCAGLERDKCPLLALVGVTCYIICFVLRIECWAAKVTWSVCSWRSGQSDRNLECGREFQEMWPHEPWLHEFQKVIFTFWTFFFTLVVMTGQKVR